jgi:predicted nucleic acid-binding protein
MSGFLDTNILIYAADRSAPIPRKTKIARELLLQDELYLSV